MRLLNEPLIGHIPIIWVCPRGPGLKEPTTPNARKFAEYLMPKKRTAASDA